MAQFQSDAVSEQPQLLLAWIITGLRNRWPAASCSCVPDNQSLRCDGVHRPSMRLIDVGKANHWLAHSGSTYQIQNDGLQTQAATKGAPEHACIGRTCRGTPAPGGALGAG